MQRLKHNIIGMDSRALEGESKQGTIIYVLVMLSWQSWKAKEQRDKKESSWNILAFL